MSDFMAFIGGAAVGTLVTYLAKNEEARKTAERFIDGMGARFTDFLHRMTPDKTQAETEAAEQQSAHQEEPVKKTSRPRRVAKTRKAGAAEKAVH